MSSIPNTPSKLQPTYPVSSPPRPESKSTQSLIHALSLTPHNEGGYFAELDRNPLLIPSPFTSHPASATQTSAFPSTGDNSVRNASTTIYYLLTPGSPQGHWHRNRGRTVHTLIEGRGRYVLVHADEGEHGARKRVESFVVGRDWEKGERSVWVVEGGKYKASYLLALDEEAGPDGEVDRLLISETVVPGFEYSDHDFLTADGFAELLQEDQRAELEWLLRKV